MIVLILVLQGACLAMVVMQWQDDALNALRQVLLLSCSLVLLGLFLARNRRTLHRLQQVNQQLEVLLNDFNLLRQREMDRSREQLIVALSQLSQFRDHETGQHILRTQMYLRTLARSARQRGYCVDSLSEEQIEQMAKAAPMHDLGKIGIPDHVLKKAGRHNAEEAAIMRTHAEIGEATLITAARGSTSQQSVLLLAARIAGGHHENWDGSGYPRGLRGQAIPLEARLMTLADVYDALTTARPYKPAWSHEQALREIRRLSGLKFDPMLVEALAAVEATFRSIARQLADPA